MWFELKASRKSTYSSFNCPAGPQGQSGPIGRAGPRGHAGEWLVTNGTRNSNHPSLLNFIKFRCQGAARSCGSRRKPGTSRRKWAAWPSWTNRAIGNSWRKGARRWAPDWYIFNLSNRFAIITRGLILTIVGWLVQDDLDRRDSADPRVPLDRPEKREKMHRKERPVPRDLQVLFVIAAFLFREWEFDHRQIRISTYAQMDFRRAWRERPPRASWSYRGWGTPWTSWTRRRIRELLQ